MPSKCELFALRDETGPILYAPLRRLSARLNDAGMMTEVYQENGKK